jgi:transposase
MRRDAGMLAELFGTSVGLGPEWEVCDAWFEGGEGDGPGDLHVRVRRRPGAALPCPECGAPCGVYDTRERVWRHLDVWQFRTFVHCAVPRTDCPEHGARTARVPWESASSPHFTAMFEAQVLAMLLSGLTVKGVASLLGESDTRLWRLVRAAVERAREKVDMSGVEAVGVDETARRRGQSYVSAFVDLDARRVLHVCEGRTSDAVASFADDMRAHGGDPASVRVVTADLSQAFAKGVAEHLPNAVRVADKFHVIQLFTKAVDRVRKAEGRESAEKARLLKGTKYIWLKNAGSLTEAQAERKVSLVGERLKTGKACRIKEIMQDIYSRYADSSETARPLIKSLSRWMRTCGIPQLEEVGRSLILNVEEIAAWFDHRKTNAMLEGVNSLIQTIKRDARGFSNVSYLEASIYLRLGGLSFDCLGECATH